jgi:hypothetical protein
MRIGVLDANQPMTATPRLFYKRSIAEDLVRRGFAVWVIPSRVIQRVSSQADLKAALAKTDFSLIKKGLAEPVVETTTSACSHDAKTAGPYKRLRIGNLTLVFLNERLVRLEIANDGEIISALKVKPVIDDKTRAMASGQ